MAGAFKGIGATLGVVGALATLVELYVETGFVDTVRRVYVETVLTDARYVGGADQLGLKVYALSQEGAWCGENVVFRMTGSETGRPVSRDAAEFFMKRFAERINDEGFCPDARSAEVYGYADEDSPPLFKGTASAAVGWHDWRWESP